MGPPGKASNIVRIRRASALRAWLDREIFIRLQSFQICKPTNLPNTRFFECIDFGRLGNLGLLFEDK